MEYYLMGDLIKAIKYHTRAMSNTLESQQSPAKRASALSLWHKDCENYAEKCNNILNQKDEATIIENLKDPKPRKKNIECVPLEAILHKKIRWKSRDLPTARVSRSNFRVKRGSLPNELKKKPIKHIKCSIQVSRRSC